MMIEQEGQLLAQIKSGELAPVYLLYGQEQYLKELYCKKLIDAAVGDTFLQLNLHQFDGNQLDMEQAAAAVEAMPFMAQRRCVVITPFSYLSLSGKGKEIFDSLIAQPVQSTVLLLVVTDPEFSPRKNQKIKKLIEQIDSVGVVVPMEKRSKSDMTRFLQKKAQINGCSISRELCLYLMERCDDDMMTLSNEIEKITAYAKGGEISREHIDTVTIKAVDARVYDLAKAILADRFDWAVSIIEELLYLRYQPTAILAALSGAYLDLYIAKAALEAGKGQPQVVAQDFDYRGRDFVVKNSLRDCRRYCIQALRQSIIYLAETDRLMKSSRADQALLLEQCAAKLLLIAQQYE